jgi:hypothetical protein
MAKKPNLKTEPIVDQDNSPTTANSNTIAAASVPEASSGATNITSGWAPFDPMFLSPPTSSAPRFPIESLPKSLASLVAQFAEARRLSVDYVAGAILTACSGAIGNRARLLTFEGGAEPLAVFTGLIGPPSVGKSLAISIGG